MSTTVDERVVEMRFDNKQFEQNIQTSLSSLDKLKKSLNLEGAAKGLETVNDAANKCSGNMSPLSNAVETVRVRFSALEVMAITALQNITNSALAAGKNLVSAFTIDPIKTGFEEYETQINAVQTILANTSSKGTTLDQVNNALDELNHYADMTIYNFTEMTRNIGTFTAAGVDLDTSVAAIKGIANLAAVSGSNSQQASTAMYQLSQALAAGTVKLQDWNSVVNAGMGGQVFQDALKETAKVHGIAIDEMIKDEGSFRETLSKGWLTSDILTETLAKFTGDLNEDQLRTMGYTDDQIKSIMEMGKTANDAATKVKTFTQLFDTLKEAAQSGWTQSWEIIVGDFEEAKELLTEVSDTFSAVINASADARNKMLQDWKDLGGRTMMIEAVKNVFEGLVSVAKPVREAFNEIFPPMTGKQLAEITERIRDLTAKFKMGEESSKNLKNTFKGVFAVLDIVGQAFKAVAGGVGELIGLFLPAGNGVLSLTGSFGEYLVKLDETVKKTDVFGKAVSIVVDIVKTVITFVKTAGEKVKEFGKAAGEKFDFPGFELFHSFLERVHDRMAQIGDGAGKMKSGVIVAFEMMGEALEKCKFTKVGEGIIAICKVIAAGAPAIGEAVKAVVLTLIDVFVSCVPQLADGALQLVVGVLAALVTYTPQIVDLAFKFLIGILDGIASNLPSLIKAGVDVLVAFFAGIVDALRGIDTGALLKGIAGIGLLSAIMLALSATASLVPGAMVGILGMGAVVAEMALVLAAVGLLSKLPGLSWLIGEGGKLLQGIGTAIGQFVGGIVGGFMSGVSSQFPQIGADLSAFMNNVQPFLQGASQIQPSMMDGVKALAETVLILTAADILQGLTSWLTGGSSLSKFGEELVPFGEAMRDFSLAIGNMDGEIVANAATAGKALAEMAATIPNTGGLVSFFAGENDMTAFGKQLVPFGEAMKQFGDAITGLDANAVTEAAIAGKAMAEMATTIPNSGGVVGFFAGENDMGEFGKQLVPFGEAMKAFGDAVRGLEADAIVNSATAGKALVELADTVPNTGGVVAFFTGNNDVDTFGEKLVPFGEAMKAYSEAIMGMDSAAITNSATAGKALVELANTISNTGGLVSWFTGDNDLGSFGDSLVQFGSGIKSYSDSISGIDTGIMSSVITQVNRLVEMAKGMAELDTSGMSGFSTALIQLGNNGIDGFINAFTDASGRVTSAATSMLTTFINAANAQKGNLTSTFTTMMQAVLTTLTNYQTQFNTAGSTLMTKFISGIKSQDGNTKTAITNIISGCITAINNKQTQFNTAGANLMIKLIAGVKSKDYETRNAFVNILSSCLTAIANKYPEFQNAGMQCMIKFIAGVKEKAEEVKTAFTGNLNASVTAIRDYHDQFKQAGTYLVEGFADGISENTYRAEAKARAMARAAAEAAEDELDEHSPSRVGYHIGDFFGLGFVNAIGTYAVKAYNASAEMADSAKTGLGNAIAKVKDMIDNGVDGQPTIRPILDLSDVEEKSHRLNTLFSRSQALTVSTGIAAARGRNLQNEDTNPNTGNSYNFTQNNYSPKALSRTEIYRQTKNQFSAMERMVET